MGLTLRCDGISFNMGYMKVYNSRVEMVRAAIAYLRILLDSNRKEKKRFKKLAQDNSGDDEERDCDPEEYDNWRERKQLKEALGLMDPWLADNQRDINESGLVWKVPAELALVNLLGVHHWVVHKDNEGALSSGQAADIRYAIELMRLHQLPEETKNFWNDLHGFMKHAEKSKKPILFT